MAAIHETAEGLHATGLLDKQAIQHFDEACVTFVQPLTGTKTDAPHARVTHQSFSNKRSHHK